MSGTEGNNFSLGGLMRHDALTHTLISGYWIAVFWLSKLFRV